MTQALPVKDAIVKYKAKLPENENPYGMGPDVFFNTQAVGLITEIDFGNGKKAYIFDFKTPGYPQVNFVDTYAFTAGNWRSAKHETPYDLLVDELESEIKNTQLVNVLLEELIPLAVYIGSVPRNVHGNLKHSASVYVHELSIYLSVLHREIYEEIFEISLRGSNAEIKESLFNILKPLFGESYPGIVTLDDIRSGEVGRFAWEFDQMFEDYLKRMHGIEVDIPGFEGIEADTIYDLYPDTPFAVRPTSKHNRLNPFLRGGTPDAQVFQPEKK